MNSENSGLRHQCLIYEGPASRQLPALAAVVRRKLEENLRVLYLNSPEMVAGMRVYLAAAGVDVAREMERGSLVLSSSQDHLLDGQFEPEPMIASLNGVLQDALSAGFSGVWASGDMAWEIGPGRDFSKLAEYERRLETFLEAHPTFMGICQYHVETLPHDAVRQGMVLHPSYFVSDVLSVINKHFEGVAPAVQGVQTACFE